MSSDHVKHTSWGEWRLAENEATCVSAAQASAIERLSDIESVGASEVRFGDTFGDLTVFHTDNRVTQVTAEGVITTRAEA